jgi:hypothetical protein
MDWTGPIGWPLDAETAPPTTAAESASPAKKRTQVVVKVAS